MAQPDLIKRPLGIGQFVWSMSKKDGKFKTLIGPDPLEATDDDIFFLTEPLDPNKIVPVNNPGEAIQNFITLKTGQYAVLHSPTEAASDEYPNGNYSSGKNDMKPLLRGRKRTITAGHFPLWPGQSVEIRQVHNLLSHEYLMVEVEVGAMVDEKAPYFDITVKCAGIKTAVVDKTVSSEGSKDENVTISDVTGAASSQIEEKGGGQGDQKPIASKGKDETPEKGIAIKALKPGQKIIIPGSLTPTYIPPTGIEVVAESSTEEAAGENAPFSPEGFVEEMISRGILKIENLGSYLKRTGREEYLEEITRYYTSYRRDSDGKKALNRAIRNGGPSDIHELLAETLSSKTKDMGKGDRVVRKAVVLGPTEFCVLFDEDGKPKNHKGPGRVFPGPYDVFRTHGSRDRIYDAYHVREDRGLLMRVVADEITRADLTKQLPEGAANFLEKEKYVKGDEIFIGGFDAYLVPSNSIEVINPETRQPHIGNDHSEVYVRSIGVDQKSGVYVASVTTGNIKLEKGEKKLLLDPRKEKHVIRRVPGRMWNLIIANGEPHKTTKETMVETPWALCVVVPNNEATLIMGKDSRRVVVGPCTELLGYEEWPEVLTLSKGRPKVEASTLETCFLRVTGNRITDQIELETADFVRIKIDVCYGVEFEGETQEEMAKWFNHRNYVMFFCYNLRSRLKLAARKMTLKDLYPVIPDFVRETILGEKPKAEEGKTTHRPGLKFEENNMRVNEVEVLQIAIPDPEIAAAITKQNSAIIKGEMAVAAAKAELEVEKAKDAIDKEKTAIKIEKGKRDKEADIENAKCTCAVEEMKENLKNLIAKLVLANQTALSKFMETANGEVADLIRAKEDKNAKAVLTREIERRESIVKFREALKEIQVALIEATSQADVDRLEAIQKGLIEALEGMGNKQLAASLAAHLPQATGSLGLLLGQGGIEALMKMAKGTPMEKAINALRDSAKTVEGAADEIGKSPEEDR